MEKEKEAFDLMEAIEMFYSKQKVNLSKKKEVNPLHGSR